MIGDEPSRLLVLGRDPLLEHPGLDAPLAAPADLDRGQVSAATSHADVLIVVADDLLPPHGWDTALTRIIGPLDPRTQSFADE
ncbi:hypothetical protein ACWEOW_17330 [Monashia sp. NPDC004114]